VGVDVEDRARRNLSPQLVSRFCSPEEQVAVAALDPDDRQDLFLKFWTLKEAYLKALGLGISVPLADLSFRLDGSSIELTPIRSLQGTGAHWTFDLCAVGASHYLAVAASSPHAAPRSITLEPFPDAWLP
jgi:4'-phosphopantetheinyl transferase